MLCLALAQNATAQISAGNVYGSVADHTGAVLPGVKIELRGERGTRSTSSSSNGEFRFLSVENGAYELRLSLPGFAPVDAGVTVTTGENTSLDLRLKLAGRAEQVSVTARTSLVDPRRVGTSTTLTSEEIHRVPNARDPWALLRTIPGVVVDRVNVAGNEGGSQAFFVGKGNDVGDNTWYVDGVLFEDAANLGTTPGYYDIGAFEEIAVRTGGGDLQTQTGGVNQQFVVKRGTNRWRGQIRGFLTHDDLQWSNIAGTELEGDPRLRGSEKADHIQQINDFGFDVGGPIVRDELFVFASFGRQDIRLVRTDQTADRTRLETWNGKLTWQASPQTTASLFYYLPSKIKNGRALGLGLQWEDSGLLDQGQQASPGYLPFRGLAKLELSHSFSPDLFLNLKYSGRDDGVLLTPQGGTATGGTLDFDAGVGRGAVIELGARLETRHNTTLDGSYFRQGWGGSHELKFGIGYREEGSEQATAFGGDPGLLGIALSPQLSLVEVHREERVAFDSEAIHLYLGDTFRRDGLTLAAGLRLDHRSAANRASTTPAQETFPELLPAIDYPGGGVGITWSDVSPRLSGSYTLGVSRSTVVRFSFARFASRLNPAATTFESPLGDAQLTYLWQDLDGDGLPQAEEVSIDGPLIAFSGVDPAEPGGARSVNRIDPAYSAPRETELVLGIDHELAPDLAVSAAYTWRRTTNTRRGFRIPFQQGWATRIGLTSEDYAAGEPATANGYTGQAYAPDEDLVRATGGGLELRNRPEFRTGFGGLELSVVKRLSSRWMLRAAFAYSDAREHYLGPRAVQNPTRTDNPEPGGISGAQVDGGQLAPYSEGSGKGDLFINARWQLSASGLCELPGGFEVSAALFARQGFPRPVFLLLPAGLDGSLRVLATPEIDSQRYPSVWNLDIRAAKAISLGAERSLSLSLDLFNVFNANTELNRVRQANSAAFGRLDEVLSPRVIRIGAALRF